jgi:hypothetical protein
VGKEGQVNISATARWLKPDYQLLRAISPGEFILSGMRNADSIGYDWRHPGVLP